MNATRLDAMANQPKTPLQNFRMDGDDFKEFVALAASQGTNASAKIRAFVYGELGRTEQGEV